RAGVVVGAADDDVGLAVAVDVADGRSGEEGGVAGQFRPAGDVGPVVEVEGPHLAGLQAPGRRGVGVAAVVGPRPGDDLHAAVAVDVGDGAGVLERLVGEADPALHELPAPEGQRPEVTAGVGQADGGGGGVAPDEDLGRAVVVDVVEGRRRPHRVGVVELALLVAAAVDDVDVLV